MEELASKGLCRLTFSAQLAPGLARSASLKSKKRFFSTGAALALSDRNPSEAPRHLARDRAPNEGAMKVLHGRSSNFVVVGLCFRPVGNRFSSQPSGTSKLQN